MHYFLALYKFEAQESDELNLEEGDLIEVQEVVEGTNWGQGRCRRSGESGQFPWNYVKKTDPPPDAADAPPPLLPRRPSSAASNASGAAAAAVAAKRAGSSAVAGSADVAPPIKPRTATMWAPVDYSKFEWFAADMERGEAERLMLDRPDGTFLVRRSKTHGGFTLSVKYEEIRHVKICEQGGKFGLADPPTFDSLLDLIKFFQRESLACYNAELETSLKYPYKTAPQQKSQPSADADDDDDDDADDSLYISNRVALRLQRQRREETAPSRLAVGQDYDGDIYEEIRVDQVKHKAQMQIVTMLKEQRTLHEAIQCAGADHGVIMENRNLLKARLVDAERNLELLDSRLRQARDDFERQKQDDAASKASVSKAGSGFNESVDRKEAERILDGKADGHFVVRVSKNRTNDPYTISMRYDGKTRHVVIKFDGTRYGLAEPLAFYSMKDLCDYYSTTPLSTSIPHCLTVCENVV